MVIGRSVRRLCIRRSAYSCPNIRQHTQVDWTLFHGADNKGTDNAYKRPCINGINSYPPSATCMCQWIGSALVQIMVCRLFGAKLLSKLMLGYCQLDPLEQTIVTFLIKIQNFSFTNMNLKKSSEKWRPFCPSRDDLMTVTFNKFTNISPLIAEKAQFVISDTANQFCDEWEIGLLFLRLGPISGRLHMHLKPNVVLNLSFLEGTGSYSSKGCHVGHVFLLCKV